VIVSPQASSSRAYTRVCRMSAITRVPIGSEFGIKEAGDARPLTPDPSPTGGEGRTENSGLAHLAPPFKSSLCSDRRAYYSWGGPDLSALHVTLPAPPCDGGER
jgi:hypothetical protein